MESKEFSPAVTQMCTNTTYLRGVQSYPETAAVGADFHSNQTEATIESIESQGGLI